MKISRKILQNISFLLTKSVVATAQYIYLRSSNDIKDDFYLEGYGLNFDDSVSDSELYVQMMSIRLISLASNSKY